ncbi:MAG: hypothetical protein KDI51_19400, partial [Xanthomonadales bacterium]|nr:hypothetical protein [Xanthomonadales bacterium]
ALEIGVVAGDRPYGVGRIVPNVPKPNDGMVTVAETRWPGARDHIVLPLTHMQMLWAHSFGPELAATIATLLLGVALLLRQHGLVRLLRHLRGRE